MMGVVPTIVIVMYDAKEKAQSDYQDQNLAASISSLLEQYQDALIQHVEAEVKTKTLAVGGESRLFHSQVREWLQSLESEVQRRREAVLSGARHHMFQRIREEMDNILEDLDATLRHKLLEVPSSSEQVQLATGREGVGVTGEGTACPVQQPTAKTAQGEDREANPPQNPQIYQHIVILNIEPPLHLLSLLHLYRSLWQTHEVSIVRAQGSADGGVTMQLRLTEPTALYKILHGIPCVSETRDAIPEAGGNDQRTIRVALKALDARRIDKHDQP